MARELTDDLKDILRSAFQGGPRGFGGRVEVDHVTLAVPPVQAVLVQEADGIGAGGATLGSPVTPGNSLLVALWTRDQYPAFVGIRDPILLGSNKEAGWTDVFSSNIDANGATNLTSLYVGLRVATSTRQTYLTTTDCYVRVYEIAGDAGLLDIASIVVKQWGTTDPGSLLGTAATDLLYEFILQKTEGGAVSDPAPAGWTEEVYSDPYGSTANPMVWAGHHAPGGDVATSFNLVTTGYPPQWLIAVAIRIGGLGTPAAVVTESYRAKRIGLDKSRRVAANQADIEIDNGTNDPTIGISPTSVIRPEAPFRCYQRFGVKANEVLTFTGLIDTVGDNRDPRVTTFVGRDRMKLLIEENITLKAPQGASEAGAVRDASNYVYLNMEVADIVNDLLDKAGWPSAARAITPTAFMVDEFDGNDGADFASTIIGDSQLTGLVGYEAGADEDGVFYFRPNLENRAPDTDTAPTPDYSYIVGYAGSDKLTNRNVLSLAHQLDDYDLKTRVKVRGPLTTLKDAWTALWHTSVVRKPTGVRFDSATPTYLYVADGNTHKVYRILQSTHALSAGGGYPSPALTTHYLNGLSGDPSDATIYWILETPWITGSSAHSVIHKVRKSDHAILASFDIGTDHWTDIKADGSDLWLPNYTDGKLYKKSKADGSTTTSYATTYSTPTGIAIDGADYYVVFAGHGVMLKYAVGAFTTVLRTLHFAGSTSGGGDVADSGVTFYGTIPELGLTYKYTLASPSTKDVAVEVVDTDLEDELGMLSGTAVRVHDTHPLDPSHSFEIRRETVTLKIITSLAQATESATRKLAILDHRRETIDFGIVGNPGHQKNDLIQIVDPITALDELFILDSYRDSMDTGYFGTIALIPYDPSY